MTDERVPWYGYVIVGVMVAIVAVAGPELLILAAPDRSKETKKGDTS